MYPPPSTKEQIISVVISAPIVIALAVGFALMSKREFWNLLLKTAWPW